MGSHHLAKAMENMGHKVVHLSPPVTPAHLLLMLNPFERQRIYRWWRGADCLNGVIDTIPGSLLPWSIARRISKYPHKLFARFMHASAIKTLNRVGMLKPDVIFIDEPRLAVLLDDFPSARIVYRPTDLYAEIRDDKLILEAELYLIKKAHKFIATSELVAMHLQDIGADNILVMENGVDLNIFSKKCNGNLHLSKYKSKDSVMAIYVGSLDHRFGYESIEAAAALNPEINFLIIGPVTKNIRSRFFKFQNIKLIGAIPFNELPHYLCSASIALLPLSNDQSNEGRSPMKLFEYAAMGLPVIATRTAELARRNLSFVNLANSPDDFALILKKWKNGEININDGSPEATKHGWDKKGKLALKFAFDENDI